MFTNEIDHDEICITVLDDHAFHEDLRVLVYDDIVYIQQWNEEEDDFMTICISPDMFDEFTKALKLPEGAYRSVPK
jgi:hypothetical protein